MNEKPKILNRRIFIFTMMGSVIGLGNIWRFPSILYTNGGSSFLIAYLIILFVLGITHLFLEYGIGFKFKSSITGVFTKINKKYEFIGWFLPFNTFLVMSYYICIVSWGFIYLLLSFTKAWGTQTNDFFNDLVLNSATPSLNGFLTISIPIAICLILMWIFVWLTSSRDINKGIGKVSSILMPLMFILMIGVVIFSMTLPGASIGINELFKPTWSALLNPGLWLVVLAQIAFSMSLGDSTAVSFTSYLDKENHLMDNALIVTMINFIFGLITSLGVFSILGFMSYTTTTPLTNIASEGTSLVFVVFPTVFNIMGNLSYIIAPLFFLSFIFAGFTTAIALFEPMSYSISEKFNLTRKKAVTILVIIGCLISLIYTTGSGQFMLNTADSFLNEISLSLIILIESIVFAWIYGAEKLKDTLNKHSQLKVGKKWIITVKYIVPAIIIFLWINGVINLFYKNNIYDWICQLFLVLLLIIIPAILTKLPAKNKKIYSD